MIRDITGYYQVPLTTDQVSTLIGGDPCVPDSWRAPIESHITMAFAVTKTFQNLDHKAHKVIVFSLDPAQLQDHQASAIRVALFDLATFKWHTKQLNSDKQLHVTIAFATAPKRSNDIWKGMKAYKGLKLFYAIVAAIARGAFVMSSISFKPFVTKHAEDQKISVDVGGKG